MESITDDWDEVEVPAPNKVKPARKLESWREAERYFKRHRDSKKVIPLRAPSLTIVDEWGSVNWPKLTEQDDGKAHT